ncbi:MAG: nicotinate-nucleotide adenylyltransferase [Thermaerobacterales bacterium]
MTVRRIGILGGTFDPVHYGHLIAGENALEAMALDEMVFVPCRIPPHKTACLVAPAEHRYELTRLAAAGNPRFSVSRLELNRPGPSYTADTLKSLARLHPGCDLYFITGIDAFMGISRWREPQVLFSSARIVVVSRPGYNGKSLSAALSELSPEQRERVEVVEIPSLDISSSDLRRRVREGRSIRYLVPEAVRCYIQDHKLYDRYEYCNQK